MLKATKSQVAKTQRVCDMLNNALENDPAAIWSLLLINKVPCNQQLVDDPFIIVERPGGLPGSNYVVGALGLLNGALTALGLPLVGMTVPDSPLQPEDTCQAISGFIVGPKLPGEQPASPIKAKRKAAGRRRKRRGRR